MNKEDVFYLYNGILDGGDKYMCVLGHVQLFANLFVAHQAPPSMGFSWQESWRGLPFPPPGDLPNPGIKPCLLHCRQNLYY